VPTLTLPGDVVDALIARARRPVEICGLLSARNGLFARHYPVRNVAADPAQRFDMDAAGLIDAFRAMRDGGESLLAIYHSHPASDAVPSAVDVAEHAYPRAACLIVAPAATGRPVRAFRICDGAADEIELDLS
jgi:proteasome lid subunit RPN8/RPN11